MNLNLANFGGLRDTEFRKFFIQEIDYLMWDNHVRLSFDYLRGEEISDKDLIRFYFAYSKLCDKYPRLIDDLIRTLFNYKLGRISGERLIHFKRVIREKTGLSIVVKPHNYMYYSLMTTVNNDEVFQELIDIFLDEV